MKATILYIIMFYDYRWSNMNNFMEITMMNVKGFSWTNIIVFLKLKEYTVFCEGKLHF